MVAPIKTPAWAALAALSFSFAAAAPPVAARQPKAANDGYSIFNGTIADLTYTEYEQAVRKGAVAIWGLGVIEEHGPHLPLATDIYGPYQATTGASEELARRNVPSVVIPVYYWGVNRVTGSFPGSIDVRPEIMIELMQDVFKSLKRDGITTVFCVSGHGDAAHNRAIFEGVKKASAELGISTYFVTNAMMAQRLGLNARDPQLVLTAAGPGYAAPQPGAPRPQIDVHAGAGETSTMLGNFPNVVRKELIAGLPPTNLNESQLAEWRRGYDHAKKVTPRGYFGAPAEANARRGRESAKRGAVAIADAIERVVKSKAAN
jgi:creatinine amidohydrolase